MADTTRAFIAIELNDEVRNSLKKTQDKLKKCGADVKWVHPGNIHITLKFLGDIVPGKLKAIAELFPSLCSNLFPFNIEISHLGAFPKIEHPRVVWVGVGKNAEKIIKLASSVENGLCTLGVGKGKKNFSPHITLGRVRSSKKTEALSSAIKDSQIGKPLTQPIQSVTLFKSILTSQGPVYEALKTSSLHSTRVKNLIS